MATNGDACIKLKKIDSINGRCRGLNRHHKYIVHHCIVLASLGVISFIPACSGGAASNASQNKSASDRQADGEIKLAAEQKKDSKMKTEKATFGAGCFWGVEAAFRQIKGVTSTAVGYEGGTMKDPTYKDVCTDRTGHAEVVQVEYDPTQVKYEQLLDVFWTSHDPTTMNRQGPDVGSQYRSAIFYHNPSQQKEATESKEKLGKSGKFSRPIVTEITPAGTFYVAEDYHQQYLEKRSLSSCHIPSGGKH